MSFSSGFNSNLTASPNDLALLIINNQVVHFEEFQILTPFKHIHTLNLNLARVHHLGQWHGRPCYLVIAEEPADTKESLQLAGLRQLYGVVDDDALGVAMRAVQLVHWFEHHAYCGRCGAPTGIHHAEHALKCSACDALYYPRISPCVIGLVWQGQNLLLARNARFKDDYFSILAGFIEPGETAEQALVREVKEEVGVDIKQPEYLYSQPWPFPSQLMLGFFAEYKAGAIQVDGDEIVQAEWFRFDQLPKVPSEQSIAGQLIRRFVQQCERGGG